MSPANQQAGISVRQATWDELPDIAGLISTALASLRGLTTAAVLEAYVENSRDVRARWDEAELLVLEQHGALAGTVTHYADAGAEGRGFPSGWAGFRTLAVHPAYRGRGLGRMLMNACLERSQRCGAATVGIHTATMMSVACRLYEATGFCRCPEYDLSAAKVFRLRPGDGDEAVLAYRLDLAGRQDVLTGPRGGGSAEPSVQPLASSRSDS